MVRAVAAGAAIVVLLAVVVQPGWAQVRYEPPVPGSVVRTFAPPATPYGHGHRGIDLAVAPGDPVRAMASGVVGFAGSVAGTSWVSVEHAGGLRTTVGPLGRIVVRTGQRITGGDLLGTVGPGAHGRAGTLHVGVRRDGVYIDPLTLLRGTDLVPTLVGTVEVSVHDHARSPSRLVLVPGTPPSPHHLVVLAGLGSRTEEPPLDPAVLGYGPDDASQFSYEVDAEGRPLDYGSEHTWQSVHDSALALQAQLRRHWADNPGQAVDLVGHSLGGLVAMYYLLVLHDPADHTLPPIGKVATVASPLRGTEAATALAIAREDLLTRAIVGLIDRGADRFDTTSPVMADLQSGSPVAGAVLAAWQRARERPYEGPLATGTSVLTFGALADPVVPAHNTTLPDAEHRMVFDTHGGAATDAYTLQALDAYLSGAPLPGPTLGAAAAEVLSPTSYLLGALELVMARPFG